MIQIIYFDFRLQINQNVTPSIELYFDYFSAILESSNESKLAKLYPYETIKAKAIFIYGNDYRRQIVSPIELMSNYWFIPIWFLFTTLVLHLIRLKFNVRSATLSSSCLDMITIFFGGGNIRDNHGRNYRIENCFIVVLLVGMFFMQSLWVSNFLSQISTLRSDSVDTLSKLSKLKTPIYFGRDLNEQKDTIEWILRFGYFDILNL